MRTSLTILDNNMTQLIIEVEEAELKDAIEATANKLSREMVIKGFRKGKAPKKLVETRIGGPAAMRAEAIRESLPDFYARGVTAAQIDPIGQPEIDITSGQEEGELVIEVKVQVRPEVEIYGHRELRVTIPSPVVEDDEIEAQITRLRETDAELKDVDRPIVTGDVVIVDVTGTDPAQEADDAQFDDYSFLVGSRSIAEGVDEMILGLRAGETLEATGRVGPNKYMNYAIAIKQVRERILPELTNEWIEENTEYATEESMRDGIMTQLRKRKLVEAQFARRDAVLKALSELVAPDLAPEALVNYELEQRLRDLSHRLDQQGISFDYFLQITGQEQEQLVEVVREESERAVRIDLALRALARVENLEPSSEEFDAELKLTAESMNVSAEVLRANLQDNGRVTAFTAEIAKMKASKWLMSAVTYVDDTGAEIDRSLLESDQSENVDA